jgi:hypothetical protein
MAKPTIQRKPATKAKTPADIEAFLGGNATAKESAPITSTSSKRGRPKGSTPRGSFRQSVPQPILEKLDAHLSSQGNPPSRNAWIVQAIVEKLKNDT